MDGLANCLELPDHFFCFKRNLFNDYLHIVVFELEAVHFLVAIDLIDCEAEGLQMFEVDDPLLAPQLQMVEVLIFELGGALLEIDHQEQPEARE
jgi:hypothetical protein